MFCNEEKEERKKDPFDTFDVDAEEHNSHSSTIFISCNYSIRRIRKEGKRERKKTMTPYSMYSSVAFWFAIYYLLLLITSLVCIVAVYRDFVLRL